MEPSPKKSEDPKEVAGIWGLYTIITKKNKLEKSDKKKEKRFRRSKLWRGKYMEEGNLLKMRVILVKFIM